MQSSDGGADASVFSTSVTLAPGDHAYQLYIDGNAALDPDNALETYADGGLYSDLRVEDCETPLLQLAAWQVDQSQGLLDAQI